MILTEDSTTASTSSSSSGDEIPQRETRSKNKRVRSAINNTTMRKSKDKSSSSPDIDESVLASNNYDLDCLNTPFPVEMEMDLLCSIFALGLKESSPKILLDLMPKNCGLSNEHIKSHLQKYRIHNERSREEFLSYWSDAMQRMYIEWENQQDWNNSAATPSSSSSSSSSLIHLDPTLMELANQAAGLDGMGLQEYDNSNTNSNNNINSSNALNNNDILLQQMLEDNAKAFLSNSNGTTTLPLSSSSSTS